MEAPVMIGGLWVQARERGRFEGPKGGLDSEVRKASIAASYSRRTRTAVDIGAHIGAITRMLAERFGHVVAIEAIPETFSLLEMNTAELRNVERINKALSSRPERLNFETASTHSQLARVICPGEEIAFPPEKSALVNGVDAVPLDSLDLQDVDFIKIDVEGWEGPVIEGARETILRWRPTILIEQAGNEAKFHGRPQNEASRALDAMGMRRVEDFPFGHDRVFMFTEEH